MQRTSFDEMSCSVARTLDVVGEWWSLLILRDVFYGISRFDVLRRHLGISRRVLTDRLGTLVQRGILERVRYQTQPDRYEYQLTERGEDLFPVIVGLMAWGDRWINTEPPIQLVDRTTGDPLRPVLISADTGKEIRYLNTRVTRGSPTHADAWNQLQEARRTSRP